MRKIVFLGLLAACGPSSVRPPVAPPDPLAQEAAPLADLHGVTFVVKGGKDAFFEHAVAEALELVGATVAPDDGSAPPGAFVVLPAVDMRVEVDASSSSPVPVEIVHGTLEVSGARVDATRERILERPDPDADKADEGRRYVQTHEAVLGTVADDLVARLRRAWPMGSR